MMRRTQPLKLEVLMKARGIHALLAVAVLLAFILVGCGESPTTSTTTQTTMGGSTSDTMGDSTSGTMGDEMDDTPEETIAADAVLEGDVQTITIDLSTGYYVPNRIAAKAGVPLEITFGQGKGCVKELVFPAFDILADMTQGPQTFKLGALEAGTYEWRCGMDMRHGVIIVE
ncbi:MAG: cupredoxin domain-containing protein [Thermoleophilia bacterium]